MNKFTLVFAAACAVVTMATAALAEIPATPTADALLSDATPEGRAIIQRMKGRVTDWAAFCKKGRENFKSEAKYDGMQLKSIKQIGGFLPDDVVTAIKYFTTACLETGQPTE